MEKKLAIVLGFIAAFLILMIITRGKILPFLTIGALGYFVYKNNR